MTETQAIQQLINRYTDGCNRQDWPQVMACFTDDGEWVANGLTFAGAAQMQPAMAGFLVPFAYFVQVNTPAVITVSGVTATARSTIREFGKFADRDEGLEVLGRYDDDIVHTPDGWKFARRTFHAYGLHRMPLSPGPALS